MSTSGEENFCPWQKKSLGELEALGVLSTVSGYSSGVHNQDGNGIPHIRPFNVLSIGRSTTEQIKYVPSSRHNASQELSVGDVVFNNTNTEELVGKTALWRHAGQFGFSNHMTRIRVNDLARINPEFLAFYLHYHWAKGWSRQVCRRHVSQASIIGDRFQSILMPQPPIDEQNAIASILTKVQDVIEIETNLVRVARELKSAVMNRLFTKGLRGEPQKETKIGAMPESWEVVSFDESLKIAQGQVDPKTEPYASMLHVGPENIESHSGYLLPCERAKDLGLISGKYLFASGDIVYSKIRPYLNKVAMPEFDGICSADMYPLKPSNGFHSRFLLHYLLSEFFLRQAVPHQLRTGIPKINREQLSATVFPKPPFNEQCEIAAILDILDGEVDVHRQKIAVLNGLFSSLLHQLMSAEIRVAELDIKLDAPSIQSQGAFAV